MEFGACSKALKKLNIEYEVADYVEIDRHAVESYNAIHNTNFIPQDVCKWDKDIKADLIMHGSPCQDFSLAGKQAGGDIGSGTRSSLMYETLRIVEKVRPKYVIWENVKNLLSKKHIHNFNAYLKKMEQLGYTNYYKILNAKDYGIPQNRERVFTVSILKDIIVCDDYNSNIRADQDTIGTLTTNCGSSAIRNGWKIIEHTQHFEFPKGKINDNKIKVVGNYMPSGHDASRIVDEEGLAPTVKENHGTVTAVLEKFEFPRKKELKLRLKDLLETEVDESYYLTEEKIEKISQWKSFQKPLENVQGKNSICPTLTARGAGEEHSGMITYSDKLENTTNIQENIKNKNLKQQLCESLIEQNKVKEMDVIRHSYSRNRMKKFYPQNSKNNNTSPTLDTRCDCLGVAVTKRSNLRIRKLTPKECFRLMGFEDQDYEKASKVNSKSQLYKQAGNSIVVNVLMAILNNLLNSEENME